MLNRQTCAVPNLNDVHAVEWFRTKIQILKIIGEMICGSSVSVPVEIKIEVEHLRLAWAVVSLGWRDQGDDNTKWRCGWFFHIVDKLDGN